MFTSKNILLCGVGVSLVLPGYIHAQQVPDSGQVLRDLKQAPSAPKVDQPVVLELAKPLIVKPGGVKVLVQEVNFRGNSVYTSDQLQESLLDSLNKELDFSELRALTDKVADFYSKNGYPFVRVYLPEQDLKNGKLEMAVIEGRYGQIKIETKGFNNDSSEAADFTEIVKGLLEDLVPGDIIKSDSLERATLIADDQPGMRVLPVIKPGSALGAGDLVVGVERSKRFSVDLGVDNHGNRYNGEYRLKADLVWNSPFSFGDQVRLTALQTNQQLWLGSLSYASLLNGSGLRGRIAYSHTSYQLGKDYATLQKSGLAKVSSAGLSYPLIRSQASNITLSGVLQHKKLIDEDGVNSTVEKKSSKSFPLNAHFDHRDQLFGGGITYGLIGYTAGWLYLDDTLTQTDVSGPQTKGRFSKYEMDISRLQALPDKFTLFARVSKQFTNNKNLDSSEGISFGGPNGVRAYPVGESSGDSGHLLQVEVRFTEGEYSPFIFYDFSQLKINASPYDQAVNHRKIAGAGLGLRYYRKLTKEDAVSSDVSVAWATEGGDPQSDSVKRVPRVWWSLSYKF
jgi:hemolysin activation/secretion protein